MFVTLFRVIAPTPKTSGSATRTKNLYISEQLKDFFPGRPIATAARDLNALSGLETSCWKSRARTTGVESMKMTLELDTSAKDMHVSCLIKGVNNQRDILVQLGLIK